MQPFNAQPTHLLTPRVSVALCTYNGARYLREQLSSIGAQTRRPDELIISDDASSDDTIAIARSFAEAADFEVIVIQSERNVGYIENFSTALARTSGDIVFLSDQDDVWHPTKVERFVAAFAARPDVQLVYGDARLVDSTGTPLGATLWEHLEYRPKDSRELGTAAGFDFCLRKGNLYCGCSMAVRSALVRLALPPPPGMPHDLWLGLLASGLGEVELVLDALIDYRQHATQTSGAKRPGFFHRLKRLLGSLRYYRSTTHYDRWILEHEALEERLASVASAQTEGSLRSLRSKLTFLRAMRRVREVGRLSRVAILKREIESGRYRRFAHGWKNLLVDLFA